MSKIPYRSSKRQQISFINADLHSEIDLLKSIYTQFKGETPEEDISKPQLMAAIASFQLAKGKYEDPTCQAIWNPVFDLDTAYEGESFSTSPNMVRFLGKNLPFEIGLFIYLDWDPASVFMITDIEEVKDNGDQDYTKVFIDIEGEWPGCDDNPNYYIQSGIDITGSHASGKNCIASGYASHSQGSDNIASNSNAHAEGQGNNASGPQSHAQGQSNIASGLNSHVGGRNSLSAGELSFAHGLNCEATGLGSVATGIASKANGYYTVAQNANCKAEGNYSHAAGAQAIARHYAQYAHGNGNWPGANQYTRTIINRLTPNGTAQIINSFTIPDKAVFAIDINVVASSADGTTYFFCSRRCMIKRIAGTVSLNGTVQHIGTDISAGSLGGISISANDTAKSLSISVTGNAAKAMNWTINIDAYEILFQ